MSLSLSNFDAVTFDVYGTLIDWEPSIVGFFADWAKRHGLGGQGRELLMEFDRARAEVQKIRPALLYPDVLRRCFDLIARDHGVAADRGEREAFAVAPHDWPPYPDSHAGLVALQRRAKVGALSNIDEASLAASCQRLDFSFDLVVTAERVGAYKPDRPHFQTAIAELGAIGVPRERILHVGQSLRADIAPANKLGVACAWINRPNRQLGLSGEGVADARPDLTVSSLTELVTTIAP
jgi:putative hydrolase of the HAD superfamily